MFQREPASESSLCVSEKHFGKFSLSRMANTDDYQSDRKPEVILIVDNLPNNINNEQLRGVFSQYGATKVRAVYRNGQFKGRVTREFPSNYICE